MTTDTKAVARYIPTASHRRMVRVDGYEGGTYVSFSDHEQVLDQVRIMWAHHLVERDNEIDRLRSALSATQTEVEGLRKDAERYRWLQKQTAYRFGKIQSACVIDAVDVLYFKSDEFDVQVDAAMEKSNEHQDQ